MGVVGIGRLGLCFALNLERAGYTVFCVDSNAAYLDTLRSKTFKSPEPEVESLLATASSIQFSTELNSIVASEVRFIFICVPTPSKADGTFDHAHIDKVCEDIIQLNRPQQETHLIINSTVMPGYCDILQERMNPYGYTVSYNPEFIAQGSILADLQNPDQVLIGQANENAGNQIETIYRAMVMNNPRISRMSRTEAEITKLAVNCFLTTKIAFANSIGDLTIQYGGKQENVLAAIGADKRIGSNFLSYGYGYGGPCLPRDNRALGKSAAQVQLELPISEATDQANQLHRNFQRQAIEKNHKKADPIVFTGLSYKDHSDIIEESQPLALAVELAEKGYSIIVKDRAVVIDQIRALYQNLFSYEILKDE